MVRGLILVVVVIGGHEEIVLLQEVGHVLADGGAHEEARDDGAEDGQQAEGHLLRLRFDGSGTEIHAGHVALQNPQVCRVFRHPAREPLQCQVNGKCQARDNHL